MSHNHVLADLQLLTIEMLLQKAISTTVNTVAEDCKPDGSDFNCIRVATPIFSFQSSNPGEPLDQKTLETSEFHPHAPHSPGSLHLYIIHT